MSRQKLQMGREPLHRFRVLNTRNPDEVRDRLASLYAVTEVRVPPSRFRFDAILNHRTLNDVGIGYAQYGAPVQITMSGTNFYTQGFGMRGYGEAVTDGKLYKVVYGQGGAAAPGATALLNYRASFAHVFLRIPRQALDKELTALLGNPPSRPIKLTGTYDQRALAAQFRFLRFVISEIDQTEDDVPALVLTEFEQTLIVAYLCTNLNNYSDLLTRKSAQIAPWQVQRAIDYIEANWDQPLTIEALALATGSSVRNLFATFKRSRGCSPMAFVRHVRLLRAREILSHPTDDTSVAAVAFRCGFHNLGHFAKKYFAYFGEVPSKTLKRGKQ